MLPLLLLALLILGIYLLRPPPELVEVPSLQPWLAIQHKKHPFSNYLRWLLSLLLALAIALSLARAVVQSGWFGAGDGELRLVLDTAPSMRATGDSGTRFEKAKRLAREAIDRSRAQQFRVADTSGKYSGTRVLDRVQAHAAIEALEPDRFPRRSVGPAWLSDSEDEDQDTRVRSIVLSDGVTEIPGIAPDELEADWQSVFESVRNASVSAFRVVPDERRHGGRKALVEVRYSSGTTPGSEASTQERVYLEVRDRERLRFERELDLLPGQAWSGVLDVSQWQPGTLEASVSIRDANESPLTDGYAPDNTRTATLVERSSVHIVYSGANVPELVRALLDNPRVRSLRRQGQLPSGQLGVKAGENVVIVAVGAAPNEPPAQDAAALLLIAPPRRDWIPPARLFERNAGPTVSTGLFTELAQDPEVFVAARDATDASMSLATHLDPRGRILLRSEPSPLVVLHVDPLTSNLTSLTSFPVLIDQLIDLLTSPQGASGDDPGVLETALRVDPNALAPSMRQTQAAEAGAGSSSSLGLVSRFLTTHWRTLVALALLLLLIEAITFRRRWTL